MFKLKIKLFIFLSTKIMKIVYIHKFLTVKIVTKNNNTADINKKKVSRFNPTYFKLDNYLFYLFPRYWHKVIIIYTNIILIWES